MQQNPLDKVNQYNSFLKLDKFSVKLFSGNMWLEEIQIVMEAEKKENVHLKDSQGKWPNPKFMKNLQIQKAITNMTLLY